MRTFIPHGSKTVGSARFIGIRTLARFEILGSGPHARIALPSLLELLSPVPSPMSASARVDGVGVDAVLPQQGRKLLLSDWLAALVLDPGLLRVFNQFVDYLAGKQALGVR